MEDLMIPCLNKELFGMDCYGCGAQRAVLLLFNGDFTGAFKMFPAIYALLTLLVFVVSDIFFRFKNGHAIRTGLIILTAAIIFINYITKMLYFFQPIINN